MKNNHPTRILNFILFLIIFTGAVSVILNFVGKQSPVSMLIMWTPAFSALMVSLLTKRSLKLIGWKLSFKWIAFGWLLPVVYAMVAYGAIWISGLGDVPNPTFIERARLTLGMESGSNMFVIVSAFFYITIVNLLPAAFLALGEEIGWRGFLVPELTGWVGLKKAGWISGIIWATWHLPGILSGDYSQQGTPLWFQLCCFFVLVITTAVILAWLRIKSGSIWPAVVFHATHNGVIQTFFDRITTDTGKTAWFTGEFGFALVPVLTLIAFLVYRNIKKLRENPL